jgi:poly(A) polymerase
MELGKTDIDIATDIVPEKIIDIFSKSDFKAIPTGIDHGTVTIVVDKKNYEITTLRKDIKTDGRHAEVEFSNDFEEDAARRDFTINSLSYDINTCEIFDYFGGIEDLKNKVVRFIGDPNIRIKEDYLRILRFFRFSCFYSDSIDSDGLRACKSNIDGLKILSKERIKSELEKILSCPKYISHIIEIMDEVEIFKIISADYEIDISGIKNFENIFWKNQKIVESLKEIATPSARNDSVLSNLRLSFLLFTLGRKNIESYLKSFRFANSSISQIINFYDFIS